MQNLLSSLMIGAFVSVIVQAIKVYFGTSKTKTILATVVISLVAGAVYYFFKDTKYWQVFLQILAFASMVYNFLIKPIEDRQV